jgi:lipoate-protein ligase A
MLRPDNFSTWRLIPLLEASGSQQMAIDNWLLEQHLAGVYPPSLRFYTWSPTAISLGYHQHKYPEHWQHILWQGQQLDIVKRPTGGRAVLHQGDLTYAVIVSGFSGSRVEVYQRICEFLIQGWDLLGVELHYGQAGRGYIHNPNCFGTATGADLITVDGDKLIGSAQLLRNGAVLQHGSMRLQQDVGLCTQVFGECFTPVQLPKNLDVGKIIQVLTQAAIDCFNISLVVEPLSEEEWRQVSVSRE